MSSGASNQPRQAGAVARRVRPALIAAVAAAGLAACSSLPESGPPARTIIQGAQEKPQPGAGYYLVPVSPQILSIINEHKPKELAPVFADGSPAPAQLIGAGDLVSVTIWESSGLFGAASANAHTSGAVVDATSESQAVSLPTQQVDQAGDISVPFAGRLPAAGLTTAQVEKDIVKSLAGKAIAPQVLVTVSQNDSSFVTVAGDVSHPGRIPLSVGGTRLLDAMALSGGATAPTSDIALQLTRDGKTRRVRLENIVRDPSENIYLRAGDLVFLVREPQSVVILGATEKNAQVAFGKSSLSLAEVVGNGGGLADLRADPYGVFVFRYEPASFVRSLGPETVEPDPNTLVPVVFQINMKSPAGYFVAQSFPMRDRDLVFVANTETVQLAKLANLVHDFASIFQRSSYSRVYN